jgi:phosphoribosylamine--glycine ligase
MKVLILGNGAREHALAWKFSTSRRLSGLFLAPGNAGTTALGTNLPDVDPLDPAAVVKACRSRKVDLVFIGPETPLEAGVADALHAAKIAVIGPDKRCAQLESSKVFSKAFMARHGLPTAAAHEFSSPQEFRAHLAARTGKLVVKKSGLAAGKGVLETDDSAEALAFGLDILKTDKLLVEEFLTGFEISVFVLSDGKDYVVLPPTADFKKAHEGDKGPNTGGMGAICPVPRVDAALWQRVLDETVAPTMAALNKDGLNYKGVVFIGVMVTESGPKILEYNVRFGDPETQPLLTLVESDFGDLVLAMAEGTLADYRLELSNRSALGVVIAAPGYPGDYPKGLPVTALPVPHTSGFHLFHAGTAAHEGATVTGGGRCFTAVGVADTLDEAKWLAYEGTAKVCFPGAWYRKDIGDKFQRR